MSEKHGDPTILAAIPVLSERHVANVVAIGAGLARMGIRLVVVANSRAALNRLMESPELEVITAGTNLGFGKAINKAAAVSEIWKWLLLINDDVLLDFDALSDVLSRVLPTAGRRSIVNLDDSEPKTVPRARDVYRNLSLVSGVEKKLRSVLGRRRPMRSEGRELYGSFSVVAISRTLWDDIGGLDERYPFTFEDSDFVRSAYRIGADMHWPETRVGEHGHSATGRAHIDTVLAASSWGAYQYLLKWDRRGRRRRAVFLCIAALVTRIPLILTVRGSKSRHFRGIVRAMRAIIRNEAPALPDYEGS